MCLIVNEDVAYSWLNTWLKDYHLFEILWRHSRRPRLLAILSFFFLRLRHSAKRGREKRKETKKKGKKKEERKERKKKKGIFLCEILGYIGRFHLFEG